MSETLIPDIKRPSEEAIRDVEVYRAALEAELERADKENEALDGETVTEARTTANERLLALFSGILRSECIEKRKKRVTVEIPEACASWHEKDCVGSHKESHVVRQETGYIYYPRCSYGLTTRGYRIDAENKKKTLAVVGAFTEVTGMRADRRQALHAIIQMMSKVETGRKEEEDAEEDAPATARKYVGIFDAPREDDNIAGMEAALKENLAFIEEKRRHREAGRAAISLILRKAEEAEAAYGHHAMTAKMADAAKNR